MLFNSFQFLIFFVVVTAFYFGIPHRHRWLLLLVSSCYFYMAFVPAYILILGFTIVVDYFAGIMIEKSTGQKRKLFLVASIVANVGVLAIFKYYNFFLENAEVLARAIGMKVLMPYLSILLPIGLSFHTFQAMSYTVEVFRGNQTAEKHFGIYSLYVMFYPQLVAGPIERPQNLLHQFREYHSFSYERMSSGLLLMGWGLFKKVVIADRLAIVVDTIYDHHRTSDGLSLLVATIFFSFQIYCDFSGYSDIAIGAAQVMGFTLMKNFNNPYGSKSISEFWTRWHISLSTWFRDYVYIPLGGNRVFVARWYFNITLVFLVSGLWHGARWTYVVWGLLHAVYVLLSASTRTTRNLLLSSLFGKFYFFDVLLTFSLVSFAWIFFRSATLPIAFEIISQIGHGISGFVRHGAPNNWLEQLKLTPYELVLDVFLIALLQLIQSWQQKRDLIAIINQQPMVCRWAIYYSLILSMLLLGVFESRQFIYFQF